MKLPAALLVLAACASDSADPGLDAGGLDAGAADARPTDPLILERPYDLDVPDAYDPATPTPLLVVLHGYGANGLGQAAFFRARFGAEDHGFLLAYPDGTVDEDGKPFWNATDACCDYFASEVDDVAYLLAVVDDVSARYHVDARRVYLMGHSNGGYMAHRLACEHPGRFAAIASLAGVVWNDPARCTPGEPIHVLQLHGDADESVRYEGGVSRSGATYPSAPGTVARWAEENGCGETSSGEADVDLDDQVAGAETARLRRHGCPAGGAVELWTMRGVGHQPSFTPGFFDTVWAWLEAHPKP
jgi:polyhydroxybutyrate depolymerase